MITMKESHTTSQFGDLAKREDDPLDFGTIDENDLTIERTSGPDSQDSLIDEMRALRNRILVRRHGVLIDIDDIVEQVRRERDEELLSAGCTVATDQCHDS
jgi:hypothetical protein